MAKQAVLSVVALAAVLHIVSVVVRPTEAKPCASMFDVVDVCMRTTNCDGPAEIVANAGAHVSDMMQLNDKISMILLQSDCWLTIYEHKGYAGSCLTMDEFQCYDLAVQGEPSGCSGHPEEHPRLTELLLERPGTTREEALGQLRDMSGRKSAEVGYLRDDASHWLFDETRGWDPMWLANSTGWNNLASSYKCDCTPDL